MILETLKKKLRDSHHKVSHLKRIDILSEVLLNRLHSVKKTENCKLLDIGCGDMRLSGMINAKLQNLDYTGVDLYPAINSSTNYIQYDGSKIPFKDQVFDVAIIVDVLHHCQHPGKVLEEARRVAKVVIIKDHFEYGFFSRTCLRIMDFYGNWAYGVSVPKKYFNTESFKTICDDLNLEIKEKKIGIPLYKHLPILKLFLQDKWHFTAILASPAVS
jgi:SAM-dependent methyltransferase